MNQVYSVPILDVDDLPTACAVLTGIHRRVDGAVFRGMGQGACSALACSAVMIRYLVPGVVYLYGRWFVALSVVFLLFRLRLMCSMFARGVRLCVSLVTAGSPHDGCLPLRVSRVTDVG